MSFESFLTFFLVIFIFGITPGPGVFALLARGMHLGSKKCIPLALGMSLSDVMYLIFACFGLVTLANNYSHFFGFIRIIGSIYLFYLAYKILTSDVELKDNSVKSSKKDFFYTFLQGFLISFSNPKVILFYIAFLPTIIDIETLNYNDVAIIALLTIIALMIGLMAISILASQTKHFLKSKKSLKKINYFTAFIMFLAGSYLLLNEE